MPEVRSKSGCVCMLGICSRKEFVNGDKQKAWLFVLHICHTERLRYDRCERKRYFILSIETSSGKLLSTSITKMIWKLGSGCETLFALSLPLPIVELF